MSKLINDKNHHIIKIDSRCPTVFTDATAILNQRTDVKEKFEMVFTVISIKIKKGIS
uniref:Uncharacterized protein n=1 Tax=Pithovirus LCPAC404 TaxID=2506597 RepID=A0A481ZC48_9VIRU|nr:MAG: hypothetical protein LCPAC404_02170 [Pithovirus LCPAC404]